MPEIKLHVSDADLARLNAQAAAAGIPRAHLVRDKALSNGLARLSTVDYHALVADAAAYMRGDLHRLHVETLVAYVITRIDQHHRQAVTRHQSTP